MERRRTKIDESAIETALMVAGFVPVIGEAADVILILKWASQKRYIEAFLMLFALIPTVGDLLVKPFMLLGKGMLKSGPMLMKFLATNPKARGLFLKLGKYVDDPRLLKLISQVNKKHPKLGATLNNLKVLGEKYISKANTMKPAASNIAAKKTLGQSFVDMGRKAATNKYLLKTGGKPPSNWLKNWYYITYMGNRTRRKWIRQFVIANKGLEYLGIKNISDLQNAINNPQKAEEIANDPRFVEFIEKTQGFDGEKTQTNKSVEDSEGIGLGNILGGAAALKIGLPLLKRIANVMV